MALPSTGKKATATPSNPGSALTDFTFIVDLSDLPQAWWDDVNTSDGTRGRAAKNDETTELPVDWIDFDDTAQTGLARIKYTGTKSASVSEPVIIYPPNTRNTAYAASDTYGQYNAYPSDLLAYLPLSSDFNDRTSNGNNATAVGSPTAGDATGQLGQATNFDGAQYLQLPSGLKNVSDGAAFVTAKSDIMASPQGYAYSERTSGVNDRLYLRVDSDTNDYAVGFADAAIAITSDNNVEGDGNYHNFTMSYNSTTAEGYLDGSSLGSYAGALAAGTATINIGSALDDTSFCFIGDLQHYLKYNTAKSTDFVSYEYSQTSDNSTFWGTWAVSDVSGGIALSGLSTTNSNATGSIDLLIDLIGLSSTNSTGSGDLAELLELAGQSSTLSTALGQISVSGLVQLAGVSTTEADISGQLNILLALSGIATTESIGQASINQLVSLIGQSTTESEAHGIIKQVSELIARATTESTGQGYISVIDLDVQLSGTSTTESIGRGLLDLLDTLLFTETYDSIWSNEEIYTSTWSDKEIYNSVIGGN